MRSSLSVVWFLFILVHVVCCSDAGDAYHRDMASRLHSRCLQDDGWACVAFKAHQHLHSGTSNGTADVDKVLQDKLEKALDWHAAEPRGKMKMMGPLLAGIILKFLALIPVALGILSLLGIKSVLASKISLGIVGLLGLKKLFHAEHVPLDHVYQHHEHLGGYHGDIGVAAYHSGAFQTPEHGHGLHFPHDGAALRRRILVIRKGKQMPDGTTLNNNTGLPPGDNNRS